MILLSKPLRQFVTINPLSSPYLVLALGRQPEARTTTIASPYRTTSLYHNVLSARELQSLDFRYYIRQLYAIYWAYRPRFFSLTDYTQVYKLLFDADQLIGQYRYGEDPYTEQRQLPRDWR